MIIPAELTYVAGQPSTAPLSNSRLQRRQNGRHPFIRSASTTKSIRFVKQVMLSIQVMIWCEKVEWFAELFKNI